MTAIPASTPTPSDVASHVLANSLTSSVVIEGPEHIVSYANRAFCRLMGKSRADLTGRPFCLLQLNMAHCSAALDRVLHSGQPEIYTQSAAAYQAATAALIRSGR